jgi:hypothetical protein
VQKRVLILTAIRMEADAIARQYRLRAPRSTGPVDLPAQMPAQLYVIGMGAIRLPDLSGQPYAAIIMAGLAGALDPALVVGDVVIDSRTTWRASRLRFKRVGFQSADEVVTSAAEKAQLFAKTGAAVVDMETAKVRAAAAAYSIPFLGIRAISDSADESIDPKVLRFIDPYGAVRVNEVVAEMFRHPSIVSKLRHLRKTSAIALGTLAEAVKEVLEGGAPV